MADQQQQVIDEDDSTINYQPPAQKSIEEILETDAEDESLRRYKESLLGSVKASDIVVVDPTDHRRVIVKKLTLLVENGPSDLAEKSLDLSLADLSRLKETKIRIKEGIQYKLKIDFIVQREIVHGLKYVQKTFRKGIPVDTTTSMVGSYAPRHELQNYQTAMEEAPSGLLYRGDYTVTSLFTDDDKNVHLKWDWKLEIGKEW